MPNFDSNPYAVSSHMATYPRSILRALWATVCSSFVFLFSFLSLGSLLKTYSFSFALTYTLEMLAEHFVFWLMFGCYASLNILFILVQKKSKPLFWPLISGPVSFLLLNHAYVFIERFTSILPEPFHNETVDVAIMAILPAFQGIVLEVSAIILLSWLRNHAGKQISNTA